MLRVTDPAFGAKTGYTASSAAARPKNDVATLISWPARGRHFRMAAAKLFRSRGPHRRTDWRCSATAAGLGSARPRQVSAACVQAASSALREIQHLRANRLVGKASNSIAGWPS